MKLSHQQNKGYLEKRKKEKIATVTERKRKSIHKETVEVKRQRQDLNKSIQILLCHADNLCVEVEMKKYFAFLAKDNAFRAKAKGKETVVVDLERPLHIMWNN